MALASAILVMVRSTGTEGRRGAAGPDTRPATTPRPSGRGQPGFLGCLGLGGRLGVLSPIVAPPVPCTLPPRDRCGQVDQRVRLSRPVTERTTDGRSGTPGPRFRSVAGHFSRPAHRMTSESPPEGPHRMVVGPVSTRAHQVLSTRQRPTRGDAGRLRRGALPSTDVRAAPRTPMRLSLLLLLATAFLLPVAVSPAPATAQTGCPVPSAVPEQTPDAPLLMPEQSRLDLFDAVWGAINEGYIDPGFNGVDWAAIGDEYAPYFLQTENAWEVYDLVEEMVGLLGDDAVLVRRPAAHGIAAGSGDQLHRHRHPARYPGPGHRAPSRLGSSTCIPAAVPRRPASGRVIASSRSMATRASRSRRSGVRRAPRSRLAWSHPVSPSGTWSWSAVASTSEPCPSPHAWGPTATSAISGWRPSMASP